MLCDPKLLYLYFSNYKNLITKLLYPVPVSVIRKKLIFFLLVAVAVVEAKAGAAKRGAASQHSCRSGQLIDFGLRITIVIEVVQ